MRGFAILAASLMASVAPAQRVLLVPLDSRPASGQFAQMIGRIAGVDVSMPPYEALGRFTTPGSPEDVLDWIERQDLDEVDAVVASTDMIAYGGLIASRTDGTTEARAEARLDRLSRLVRSHPRTRLYLFSSVMRLAPTATRAAAPWRLSLAKFVELRDRAWRTGDKDDRRRAANARKAVPPAELTRYEGVRARDHAVQRHLVEMVARGGTDYLVFGQDDARPFGPHVAETQRLRDLTMVRGATGRVHFCEGIDQHANVLLSRALLASANWSPTVRVDYADPGAARRVADYESRPIGVSLEGQILASGARVARPGQPADYTLFVDTPGCSDEALFGMLGRLDRCDTPAALADINLAKNGTSDPRLVTDLGRDGKMMDLAAFAGWNTAGNTLGTAIPAANVYLLARRTPGVDPVRREIAQREFLLHRYVNDYSYHRYTRPEAYRLLDALPGTSREETYGEPMAMVNQFVRKDLSKRLADTFRDQLFGRRFEAGDAWYVVSGLDDVRIWLPWPRAYEVRLEFRLDATPVVASVSDR